MKNFNSDKNSIKYEVLGEYGKEGLRLRDVARSSGGKVSSLLPLLAFYCGIQPLGRTSMDTVSAAAIIRWPSRGQEQPRTLTCLPFDLWKNWRWLGTYSNVAWCSSTSLVSHKPVCYKGLATDTISSFLRVPGPGGQWCWIWACVLKGAQVCPHQSMRLTVSDKTFI